jgi:hypothetical protein
MSCPLSLFAQDGARLQLHQQRLGVLQVGGVEAFGKPAVDLREHRARLGGSNPRLSTKQAEIYGPLWRTRRNSHVCVASRSREGPESDRMGLFWAHSADFSPRRGEAGPFGIDRPGRLGP